MKTIVLTGLSGAGKSQAANILEEAGFFCVDNVPPKLVNTFIKLWHSGESEIEKLALVTDIRGDVFHEGFATALAEMSENDQSVDIIFLEADEQVLVKRYQETRRQHPLAKKAGSLLNSIQKERSVLKSLRHASDYVIDTSHLKTRGLELELKKIIEADPDEKIIMQLNFSSFGFKYGMPVTADFVFDLRFIPNPFYIPELRGQTGEDAPVRDYVMAQTEAQDFFVRVRDMIEAVIPAYIRVEKKYIEVAFGCTGGQHRSATFAYLMEETFREMGHLTNVSHRDMRKNKEAIHGN